MNSGSRGYLGALGVGSLLAALALTGCTPTDGGEAAADEAAAQAQSASATATTDPPDDPEPTDDPPSGEPETPASAEPTAAGGDCLVGAWVIPESELQEFYGSVSAQAEFTIVGEAALTFSEDTFEYLPDFVLEMNLAGQEAEGVVGGSVSGSYTSADGVITTSNEDNSMEVAIRIGGQEFAGGGDMADSFLDESPVNSAPYECGADGPVLMFQNGGADDRIPMHLQPAS